MLHASGKSDGIVFLHAVADGPANESYGLQVAKLAGVPGEAIRRARSYLTRIEKFNAGNAAQPDLFAQGGATTADDASSPPGPAAAQVVGARLAALDPDAMSPREALAALYELKRLQEDS